MTPPTYRIVDEPRSSRLSNWMVNPFWIVLATMLGGVWLGWPWFAFNSLAVGSFQRARELLALVVGLVGTMVLAFLGISAAERGWLQADALPYAGLVLVLWKLTFTYALQLWQSPSYELALYFRGQSRNGAALAFTGLLLRAAMLRSLPDFWLMVLS